MESHGTRKAGEKDMNDNGARPEEAESRAALKAIRDAQMSAIESTRGPIWLTLMATGLLAFILMANWLLVDDHLIHTAAMLAFLASWIAYAAALRRRGIKIRFIPSSAAGRWFLLGQAVFYISIILGADWLFERGHTWASWVATAILCLCFMITVHYYPTGEPVSRTRRS
jgi:hypothetical protein